VKLLLDTCTFLWFANDDPKLSPVAKRWIEDGASEVFLSAVSSWEISRKYELQKLALPEPPEVFLALHREANRFGYLPLDETDLIHSSRLPLHHRDPADRMLIAQASLRGLTILTPDPMFRSYAVRVIW